MNTIERASLAAASPYRIAYSVGLICGPWYVIGPHNGRTRILSAHQNVNSAKAAYVTLRDYWLHMRTCTREGAR